MQLENQQQDLRKLRRTREERRTEEDRKEAVKELKRVTSEKVGSLVENMAQLRKEVTRIKAQLERAESRLRTAEQELGSHLAPNDVKYGEVFGIWFGDSMLEVRFQRTPADGNVGEYLVGVRQRGKIARKL